MTRKISRRILDTACSFVLGTVLLSVASAASGTAPEKASDTSLRRFVSDHTAKVAGKAIRYRASVEEHILTDTDGNRTASVYTFSYERRDLPRSTERPVIFAFNGGPGSASLWLHLGLLGPVRVASTDSLTPTTVAPFRTVDNEDTPLDVADIVLIDPVGTGYSRMLPAAKPDQFLGVDADALATVKIIEQWLRDRGRMNAPKYLLSESYGTIRAAVVAKLLAGGPTATGTMNGITLNGLILLGPTFDLEMGASSDTAFATALPTLAATACFHGKGPANCTAESAVLAGRQFARGEYLATLFQGADADNRAREDVANRLGTLIGLDPKVVLTHDLRITTADYAKLLLSDQAKQLGMYDARYVFDNRASGGDPVADDPAMGSYVPGFVGAMDSYLHNSLGVDLKDEYRAIAFKDVNGRWDYGRGPGIPQQHNYAIELAVAMRRNPSLKVMIGNGYYDLVTTLGQAEYTTAHAGIAKSRLLYRYYPSGHMSYMGGVARKSLAKDIRDLVGDRPLD